ncbi:hypothetical protein NUSPORA_00286 [Nucleospora cyclopteri]
MCNRCITNSTNLLSRIRTSMVLESCRGCERYNVPPRSWKPLSWGSQALLIFCLQKNKSIKKLNIVDAQFIYTEEHSKKINIEIKVLEDGVTQNCILKYSIRNKQCGDCMRAESKQFWNAVVQVRQHPPSKRTFLYLEQLIKKHNAHMNSSNIKEQKEGIDFFFLEKSDALKLTKFLENFYGTKTKDSSRLVSEDRNNNTANSKNTFSVELLPLCKDDLYKVDKSFGLGEFAVVKKVNSNIEFMNPISGDVKVVSSKYFFANAEKFKKLQNSSCFEKYEVLLCNKLNFGSETFFEVTITKDQNEVYEIRTHCKLKEGDFVLGYEVSNKNFTEEIDFKQPIILVRKYNQKKYKMKNNKEISEEMRLFLDDIKNDKEMLGEICEVEEEKELESKLIKLRI